MTDTDLHQPGLGPLRAAAEAAELARATSWLVSIDGCRLADSNPLAPLTAAEMRTAASIVKSSGRAPGTALFSMIALQEPPKDAEKAVCVYMARTRSSQKENRQIHFSAVTGTHEN